MPTSTWRLAPTLDVFRRELNEEFPLRDKTSDGTLGNAAHAASKSDHNPDGRRVVCAIDVDEDLGGSKSKTYPRFNPGRPAKAQLVDLTVAKAKVGELPWLAYVIYEGKIYSRTYGWVANDYDGPNAHDHHAHFSVRHDAKYADSTRSWRLWEDPQPEKPLGQIKIFNADGTFEMYDDIPAVDLSILQQARVSGRRSRHVFHFQRWLTAAEIFDARKDGYWGGITEAACDAFNAAHSIDTRGPVWKTLVALRNEVESTKPIRH